MNLAFLLPTVLLMSAGCGDAPDSTTPKANTSAPAPTPASPPTSTRPTAPSAESVASLPPPSGAPTATPAQAPAGPTVATPAPADAQVPPSGSAPAPADPDPKAQDPKTQDPKGQDPKAPDQKPLPRVRLDHDTMRKVLFNRDPDSEPVDNPSTPEKVALGKALYDAPLLGVDGKQSCASCHALATYGTDGKAIADGGKRNAPTTWNAFRQFRQGWDGRAATVEELGAHGLVEDGPLVERIKAQPALVDGFAKAFGAGDTVTAANTKLALGTFLRTLVTKSRWDAYLDGDNKALTQDELYGLHAFQAVGCTTCHMKRPVGGNMHNKTGALKPYSSSDVGRMAITNADPDKFYFKVPQLLNVEKTAPYMHDGKVKTLDEIVTLMADIQLDKKLTPEQHRGIVAFLKALTGELPAEYAAKK